MADLVDPQRPTHREDDLIDVSQYLSLLWKKRILVGIVAVGFALLAAFGSWWLGPSYRAEMLLGVTSNMTIRPDRKAQLATVAALVQSQTTMAGVIDEFGLAKPPYGFTVTTFRRNAVVVEPVEDADYLRVSVSLPDPALAAKVANGIGTKVLALATSVGEAAAERARFGVRGPRDAAAKRYEDAAKAYSEYRDKAQIEMVRRDVDLRLGQRGTLTGLLVEIESQRASIAQIATEMAKRQRIGTISQSIASDPTMMEAARQAKPEGGVLGLQLKSEYVDTVYEQLERELTTRQAKLAGLEKEKAELAGVRKLDGPQLAELSRLYDREAILARLEMERDLAKRAYTEATVEDQGAQLRQASQLPILQLVDQAIPPTEPVMSPKRAGLIGLLAGIFLGSVAAIGRQVLGFDR